MRLFSKIGFLFHSKEKRSKWKIPECNHAIPTKKIGIFHFQFNYLYEIFDKNLLLFD